MEQRRAQWQNREQFFAVASRAMRRVLVDHARARMAAKRGDGQTLVALDEARAPSASPGVDVLALDRALDRLAGLDPRQARVVELRYSEASRPRRPRPPSTSHSPLNRDWAMARASLFRGIGAAVNPERRERLKEVFEAAHHLEPGLRPEYLAGACAGRGVRREAEYLLASLEAAGPFIESPAAPPPAPAQDPILGSALGPWRLVGEIARGGMGIVYRAVRDDASFRKEAAVKVLPGGIWDAQALAQFRSERDILAQLDHPSITRPPRRGTAPDGPPCCVMDLVEDEVDRPAASVGLVARERLDLNATICDAVHYAHQSTWFLHRDLKPANILVATIGTPRLLELGIAGAPGPDGSPRRRT